MINYLDLQINPENITKFIIIKQSSCLVIKAMFLGIIKFIPFKDY